ncbi:MipA/OmpV family protein [Erwinia sp. S43]|uniref:MipA/OmpV family protein n=1 Tax=Erwinia sp. S43 TaxID=2769339 RepID=UPI00190A0DB7|nr:MipA/OmpV family protein [Erwinia sp. S43]MBK0033196.1 MipA/OmpV family protein [Erwinia sp. S43]
MKKMNFKCLSTAGVFTGVFFSGLVSAAENEHHVSTVGLGFVSAGKYSGSDERTFTPSPFFHFQYNNIFLDDAEGLGMMFELTDGFYFSQAMGYSSGRSDKNSSWKEGSEKLKGMGSIKGALTSSTTLGWSYGNQFSIEANLTAPLTDSQGVKYRAGINYNIWSNDSDTLVIGSNANFGDARSNNTFYGISETQSAHSGYAKYKAGSGLYSVDTRLTWTHIFNKNWWSYADVSYTKLGKNVRESNIVFKDHSTDFSVGLLYSF